ncbi:dTDP-glucose 4,6-dehydratase [Parachlamydia sp. AcF125]|uniref:dTDP-glucose 4,6-dehydratase n=1 Tax=Parachlamydia sp. AcF125 TaxID=2795736 RepID=UPI001BC97A95|nr:dTDP-glucose 4,6-dehydratase [Parachlamydia sp. AcF125]MBS4168059.1 dTDP-glucose 4,6-dehydratase [Parachlamydia sp. AcF125]
MVLVTGGAGFIGSNFIRNWLQYEKDPVVNLDKLTYAGNLHNLSEVCENPLYRFVRGDIQDRALVREILLQYQPRAIIHFAAESHVDRSIHSPSNFIQTNILGTYCLLEEALAYWKELSDEKKKHFRFLHISTDEVFGSLSPFAPASTETSAYLPKNPYSASKAAADHLVEAFGHTYQLPILITRSANNFGPCQFPEKFIPHLILQAMQGKPIPLYGDGLQVRNWIYVQDHCNAIRKVLIQGTVGESYNIAGIKETTNLELAEWICEILDELKPDASVRPHSSLIVHVKDRPGHDRRYALDGSKIGKELSWMPEASFETQLRETLKWYLNHPGWVNNILSGEYQNWIKHHYQG